MHEVSEEAMALQKWEVKRVRYAGWYRRGHLPGSAEKIRHEIKVSTRAQRSTGQSYLFTSMNATFGSIIYMSVAEGKTVLLDSE